MAFYTEDVGVAEVGKALVETALAHGRSKGLTADDLALSLVIHEAPLAQDGVERRPLGYGWRSAQPFYPCSVVKIFWLVACHARLEEGFIRPHQELDRAMHDMIAWSSNTATNYVIDLVTGTTGDTLLQGAAYEAWAHARNWANRYFHVMGVPEFEAVNVCQKAMDDERYGRENQFAGERRDNLNSLTTDATACLYQEILTGRIVSRSRCRSMQELLRRPLDPDWVASHPASQVKGYFGAGMPEGTRLWSKAGWTGWTGDPGVSYRRHDSAYAEAPSCPPFTLVLFTQGEQISADGEILPKVATRACELLRAA